MQLLIQTIQNIISNYIPHETITCDDSKPPWINEKMKKLILHKNHTFKVYFRDRDNTDLFNKFQSLQAHLKTTIEGSKLKYDSHLSDKVSDSKASPKSYWSILKTFLNDNNYNNMPVFHVCCTMVNSSWTLRKRLNSLLTSFQNSVLLLITTVTFPWFFQKNVQVFFIS